MGSNTILITGGSGNLARLLAEKLCAESHQVLSLDLRNPERHERIAAVDYFERDVRDNEFLNTIISERKPQIIFHMASLLSGSSEMDRRTAWEINATASFNLFESALEHKVDRIVFPGTAASYGNDLPSSLVQDFPQWPENIYGVTKVACERLGFYYRKVHGLDFRCIRLPMVISPFAPKNAVTAYASHAYVAAAKGQAFSFPVSADTGMSTIYVKDVVDALVQIAFAPREAIKKPAYNLHSFYPKAKDFTETISKIVPDFEYAFNPKLPVDELLKAWPNTIVDTTAREDWQWKPAYNLEKTTQDILEWLKNLQH